MFSHITQTAHTPMYHFPFQVADKRLINTDIEIYFVKALSLNDAPRLEKYHLYVVNTEKNNHKRMQCTATTT